MSDCNWRDHLSTGRQQFLYVFQNNLFSDVKFLIRNRTEQTHVYSHSFVLKVRSTVFEKLLEKEKVHGPVKEIVIDGVTTAGFKRFIQFLYTDELEADATEALEILPLSRKYRVYALTAKCTALLKDGITEGNVASIFQVARDLKEIELEQKAIEFIQNHTTAVFSGKDFLELSIANLCVLLKMNELHIREIDLFKAVLEWGKVECARHTLRPSPKNMKMMLKDVIPLIRFPVMSLEDFNSHVIPQDILSEKEVKEIVKYLEAGVADKEFVKPTSFSCLRRDLISEEDIDLSKTDEENHKRLAKLAISKSNPPQGTAPMIVTSLILEVDPLDDSIDVDDLKAEILKIKKYGLYWGATNTLELPGGKKKLRISFAADTRRSYGVGTVVETVMDMDIVSQAFVHSYRDEIVVRV